MSTADVPGAQASHRDDLTAGCWAEEDNSGSLIFVKGTENDIVVYDMFDRSIQPVQVYTDAMTRAAFEKLFSYPPTGTSPIKWIWHDKTPFPWNTVMEFYPRRGVQFASAADQLSAAAKVAHSLGLRARNLSESQVAHLRSEFARRGSVIVDKVKRALDQLRN